MKIQNIEIDPAKNPAVLDTATWDIKSALDLLQHLPMAYLERLCAAAETGRGLPSCAVLTPYNGSLAENGGDMVLLAGLADGQQIFAEFGGQDRESKLGRPFWRTQLPGGKRMYAHKTDAQIIDRFFRKVSPIKGPRALGGVPRLGIGVRMTTACWPGIIAAMARKKFKANMIQNSVRELNMMSTLLEAAPAEKNYACGFGTIEAGYTGSSFEGLWVAGVLAALQSDSAVCYGADADHIQVKRGAEGVIRAQRIIDCARYYTFYTIDAADILDYKATTAGAVSAGGNYFECKIPNPALRNEIIDYHGRGLRILGRNYKPERAMLGRFIGKYWDSLEVLENLEKYIKTIKGGQAFDLEFAIDEHPPETPAFDCLSADDEIIFVLAELRRRGVAVTHIAPNFGVEKGVDYRCPDGLAGFEKRVESQFRIAEEFGVMLDFHSADDLSSGPRDVIKRVTRGKHHFKISPRLQLIYAEVLRDFHPDLFRQWWDDALAYARREAEAGSKFALECIREYEHNPDKKPSHRNMLFHHYSFAFVGRRDAQGRFLHRQGFYDLSKGFYDEYRNRLISYLGNLADELF